MFNQKHFSGSALKQFEIFTKQWNVRKLYTVIVT